MTDIVFYFQVHQPFRLRRYTFFDIGHRHDYFDDEENARILRRVAEKCYRPMNALLLDQIERHAGALRLAFSLSGTVIDQLEAWSPETLESFVALARTGCVEFLCETSHHSLAALARPEEFARQVAAQSERVTRLFGRRPTTFRNTELVCSNAIAAQVEALGFDGMLAEGADPLLGWRSPHHVYRTEGTASLKLLLRDYAFSDDIAFRFSNRAWSEWPLTADRFAHWLHQLPERSEWVGLFMDYETFGEHQWVDTGIFDFMAHLPDAVLADPGFRFLTPSEVLAQRDPVARLDIPHPISWADTERDLTAWLGNPMQLAAQAALYDLLPALLAADDPDLMTDWRRLSTSDHLYYMCTKWFSDGDVHKYFSPYDSPYDSYINFMNVLDNVRTRMAEL